MIPLEQIKIASPCSANWEAMEGNEQSRFCQGCQKNVYNLSEMTRQEAEALIARQEGKLCVRFYTRSDGTVLTQDCPAGVRAVRKRFAQSLSWAAALVVSCWSGLLRLDMRADAVQANRHPAASAKTGHSAPKATPHRRLGQMTIKPKPVCPPLLSTMGETVAVPPRPTMGAVRIAPPPAPKK